MRPKTELSASSDWSPARVVCLTYMNIVHIPDHPHVNIRVRFRAIGLAPLFHPDSKTNVFCLKRRLLFKMIGWINSTLLLKSSTPLKEAGVGVSRILILSEMQ